VGTPIAPILRKKMERLVDTRSIAGWQVAECQNVWTIMR
jgi:hypothetical protein